MPSVVSSTWLVASHLAWSSTIHTGRFFGVSRMPWPRFRLGTGQQEVKDRLVETGMKSGWLSASNRLAAFGQLKVKIEERASFRPRLDPHRKVCDCQFFIY